MPIRFVAMIAIVALLAGCGGRPIGVMTPTGQTVAGTTPVNLLVATTRAPRSESEEASASAASGSAGEAMRILRLVAGPALRRGVTGAERCTLATIDGATRPTRGGVAVGSTEASITG